VERAGHDAVPLAARVRADVDEERSGPERGVRLVRPEPLYPAARLVEQLLQRPSTRACHGGMIVCPTARVQARNAAARL
jgi:hypothetical protein